MRFSQKADFARLPTKNTQNLRTHPTFYTLNPDGERIEVYPDEIIYSREKEKHAYYLPMLCSCF